MQELGIELLHLNPQSGPVSKMSLALATANMNARLRQHGLSSRELWTQRDLITGEQLPIKDMEIVVNQFQSRQNNHMPSSMSKSPGRPPAEVPTIHIGDLVYIKVDKEKTCARDKYLVATTDTRCQLRKFSLNPSLDPRHMMC